MFGIVAIGDSIILGRGNNEDGGWVGRLKQYWEPKKFYNVVYNLGIPGDTSVDLLDRFENECKVRIRYLREGDKHVLIIGIGVNDSRLNFTLLDDFQKNIQELITIAKKHTSNVVVLGLTPVDEKLAANYEGTTFFNDRIKQFDKILKDESTKNKVHFVEVFDKMIHEDVPSLMSDGIHPNSEGYEFLYQIIKNFLVKNKILD